MHACMNECLCLDSIDEFVHVRTIGEIIRIMVSCCNFGKSVS
jgi:hypothetical protein